MSDINLRCQLSSPYPQITVQSLNKYDCIMLSKLFFNKLSSVSEYLMSSILVADTCPELSDIFECVAMSETRHFKLIGRMLVLSCSLKISKSGTSVNLIQQEMTRDSKKLIDTAIKGEMLSISNMKLVNSQIHNSEAKKLLSRIIKDDEHHVDIFTQLKQRYN